MELRRVAITGLGVLSPVGRGKAAFWDALSAGRSGFAKVSSFDAAAYRTHVGAEVKDSPPRLAAAYAVAAAREALADSGAGWASLDPACCGVALGTTVGEMAALEKVMDAHLDDPSPAALLDDAFPLYPGGISAEVGRALGFGGPNIMLTTACSAGNAALDFARRKIQAGRADLMAAGGVDVFNRVVFSGFNKLLAVAPEACAPFSKGRKGLIPAEGCAILILEDYDKAAAAGRRIYAEVLGCGLSSDASHVTMPDAAGIARAIQACLEDAGLRPAQVDYINAHGTGTPANDRLETAAIKTVFGARARSLPVSSIKSMTGHAMGAASALEAAACCLSLETGLLPPTLNFTPGDPECDLDYVPNRARKTDPRIILSNAFAFGGSNAVVAFGKPGERVGVPPPAAGARVVITGIGQVSEKDPAALAESLLPDKDLSYIDKPMAYALCAAKRALDDAGLAGGGGEIGIILDSSGELESVRRYYADLARGGPSAVEPRLFPIILANAAASRAAIAFGLKLLNLSFGGSFPGGESSLAAAFDFLRRSGRGIILAGGVDEGGVMFVVETLSGAQTRGAKILTELIGCEESFDVRAAPRRDGGCFCLAKALQKNQTEFRGRGRWGGEIRLRFQAVDG